jgi:GT2 family glycosyltransferase
MNKEMMTKAANLSISVVSHGQMSLVLHLMRDIQTHCDSRTIELILTLNIPEPTNFDNEGFSYPITIVQNRNPKGFGANHNQAFRSSTGEFFCVLNPDIRIGKCPFNELLRGLQDSTIGVIAPTVLGVSGAVEDSARRFPTVSKILRKVFSRRWMSDYPMQGQSVDVDWVGGMFMLFRRSVFAQLHGFNEFFFLYYEDVDLCARINLAGLRVVVKPAAQVVHHAQHSSHRSLKYLRWHVGSLLRFLRSSEYRQLKRLNRI